MRLFLLLSASTILFPLVQGGCKYGSGPKDSEKVLDPIIDKSCTDVCTMRFSLTVFVIPFIILLTVLCIPHHP